MSTRFPHPYIATLTVCHEIFQSGSCQPRFWTLLLCVGLTEIVHCIRRRRSFANRKGSIIVRPRMKLMQVNTCTIQRRKLLSKRSRECHLLAPSDRQHEFHTTFLDLEQYDVIRHKKLKHNPCNSALHSRVRSCSFLSFVPSESLDYEQIYGGTDEEEDWRRKA